MNIKNWKKYAFFSNMIGCFQFILLTFIGMLFYAGGTSLDPTRPGYSFFQNFFSEIGLTVAHSGESNIIAFIFFSLAFFIVGITLMPSFIAFPFFFKDTKIEKWLTITGSALGLFTSFCFTGITFAPADINIAAHAWFVQMGFTSGFVVSLLYSAAIFLNKTYPKKYAYNFMVFTVFLLLYLLLMFMGPSRETIEGLTIQATAQKIILYTFAICLFIHGYGAWKQEKNFLTTL
ncbi:MAG: hypothetical protein HWN81_06590 [Candidatus Lokiarchaeota archaeon]|nr:hypothetical protein [Candidatus Lokiarchaeota archaeon]